jgi:hypothetical protein
MKPERRPPETTLTMELNSMTKATLLMVAGLVVAAAPKAWDMSQLTSPSPPSAPAIPTAAG